VEECCSVCTDFSLMGTDAVCSRECASLALHGCAKTFCQGHDKEWGEKEHPGFFPPTHPVTYWRTPPSPRQRARPSGLQQNNDPFLIASGAECMND